jgi:oligosaccharide 4-alpha-D-glucosyltransferase
MKKLQCSVLFLFVSLMMWAQSKSPAGEWTFQQYSTDILKVTFKPDAYHHNENITGAVIMKPQTSSTGIRRISADNNSSCRAGAFSVDIKNGIVYVKKGIKQIAFSYIDSPHGKGFAFQLGVNEKIFGGGERALPLNRRGYKFNLYNNPWYGYGEGADNLNYSVPFISSSRMYGLFFDNASKGVLDIGKSNNDLLQYTAYSGELNFYFITSDSYAGILKNYHSLTGTQPLPPRWALGSFMSRFGYTSEKQTRDIYGKMRVNKIPFDAVIFDLFWFGDSIKKTLGNLDWMNKEKWPNPKKMIADFKNDGVQTILVTEPFVLENTRSYDAFKPYFSVDKEGKPYRLTTFYFGYGGLIDIFRPEARALFWSYYKKQMNNGVEGWWGDLGEPEKHPEDLYHDLSSMGYKRLFSADEVHNVYGHYWSKMLYEKYAQEYPSKRLFSLNRSGFAGTQRYAIFPWTGDVSRSWSGFRAQLPIMLGMSMSGVPYVHADAGGFAGGEGDWELYVRWLQFAQFTPVFRPHGTALYEIDPAAYSFPSEIALADTPYRQLARMAAVNRYSMLPYNYTLSYLQASKAEPLVSPLYYYFSNDTTVYNVQDEFMWGKNVLVAPVIQKEAAVRNVYLPAAEEWYEWNGHEIMKGGSWFAVPVTLNHIPVYVKAGSLIPLVPEEIALRNTSDYKADKIEWHYYAGANNSSYTLYDDDGKNKNALSSGSYELITASASTNSKGYRIRFSSNGGEFRGKPTKRKFSLILHGVPETYKALVTKTPVQKKKGKNGEMIFEFDFNGSPVTLSLLAR